MKLLIDENLPRILVERLTRRGDDVLWARERLRGAADEELIALAQREQRTIITQDKGFGDLVLRRGHTIGVVLIRSEEPTDKMVTRIFEILGRRDDWDRFFTVVSEDGRVRSIPLP